MITLLHGDDEFTIAEHVRELRARAFGDAGLGDLNVVRLDPPPNLNLLQDHANTIPFLGDTRLVIVHGWLDALAKDLARGSVRAQEMVTHLVEYLATLPESTHLVFVETTPISTKHPVLKAISAWAEEGNAEIRSFIMPHRSRDRREFVMKWIRSRMRSYGAEIDPQAVRLLTEVLGHNLRLLDQELQKLRTHVGENGYVTPDIVHALVPYTREASVFEMIAAIGQRNVRQAIHLLQQNLSSGQHPLQIMALIIRQYRIYMGLKDLSEQGVRPEEMAAAVGIPAWTVRRDLNVARRLSWRYLERVMEHLLDVDVQIKQGKIDPDLALQILVIQLAG